MKAVPSAQFVPVCWKMPCQCWWSPSVKNHENAFAEEHTMLVLRNIVASVNWSCTFIRNRSPLLPRITGPGKVPPGRTALFWVEGLSQRRKDTREM